MEPTFQPEVLERMTTRELVEDYKTTLETVERVLYSHETQGRLIADEVALLANKLSDLNDNAITVQQNYDQELTAQYQDFVELKSKTNEIRVWLTKYVEIQQKDTNQVKTIIAALEQANVRLTQDISVLTHNMNIARPVLVGLQEQFNIGESRILGCEKQINELKIDKVEVVKVEPKKEFSF